MRDTLTIATALLLAAAVLPIAAACDRPSDTDPEPTATAGEPPDRTVPTRPPFDVCAAGGLYGDGECHWYCPEADPDCEPEPLGPEPDGTPTQYPIVLAHGFMAGPDLIEFYRVPEALREDGHEVIEGAVPPFAPVPARADHLADQIDALLERTGADKVNIVAHSMGGLDARYLISSMGYADRVASLTTISTPHRGSRTADAALDWVDASSERAVNGLAELVGTSATELAEDPDFRGALSSLATSNMESFNDAHSDAPNLYYQSWAGVSHVGGLPNLREHDVCDGEWWGDASAHDVMSSLLVPSAKFVSRGLELVPNDGMVAVESAKWGNFRGCLPADHADEVGQFRDDGADEATGFDHIRFYRHLAYDLADRGY